MTFAVLVVEAERLGAGRRRGALRDADRVGPLRQRRSVKTRRALCLIDRQDLIVDELVSPADLVVLVGQLANGGRRVFPVERGHGARRGGKVLQAVGRSCNEISQMSR